MVENDLIITCLIYLTSLHLTAAQLPETERLINITECDLKATINLACGADEMIAIHSLQYAYHVLCESTCCSNYDSSNCFVNGDSTDIQDLRRSCSGKTSCIVSSLKENTDFCAFGVKPVSYVFLQYYCIPNSRRVSICGTSKSLTSDDAPLYITNENYPSVTTGSDSCSCSLEAYSCSSSINLYIIDADLYHETNTCEQNLVFKNGTDATLKTIGCENYYTDNITSSTIGSHFSRIDFINNSTSNQEGLFFVGLKASEAGVTFRLDCTSGPETWCIGCGALQNIANGNIALKNENDSSYGAQADVNCDNGYETNTPTITCPANSTWPDAVCTQKAACTANQWRCTNGDCIPNSQRCDNAPDCSDDSDELNCAVSPVCPEGLESCLHSNGSSICVYEKVGCVCDTAQVIENGDISLRDNSTIGSVADVTCKNGYVTSTPNVTCLTSGLWEPASCTVIDCGPVPKVKFGSVTLDDETNTTFAATASVTCRTGYYTSKKTIMCQASGKWKKPMCKFKVTTTSSSGGAGEKKTPLNLPLIIVLVVLAVLLLVQLVIVSFLQCKIHSIRRKADDENAEFPKRILMIIAGSIPILGFISIYFSWKVFDREVYHVTGRNTANKGNENMSIDPKMQKEIKSNGADNNNVPLTMSNPTYADNGSINTHNEETIDPGHIQLDALHEENPPLSGSTTEEESAIHNKEEVLEGATNQRYKHLKGSEQKVNPAPHQENTVSDAITQQNSNHPGTGSGMTRGLSATFGDVQDDMDPGRVAPVMHHTTSKTPKLPTIQQHPEDDHHHHHFSKDVEDRRHELQPVINQARKDGKHVELVRGELYINNCLYRPENTSHDAHIDHNATHSNQHVKPTENHSTHINHRVAHGGNQHATHNNQHVPRSDHHVAYNNHHDTRGNHHDTRGNHHATQSDHGSGRAKFF